MPQSHTTLCQQAYTVLIPAFAQFCFPDNTVWCHPYSPVTNRWSPAFYGNSSCHSSIITQNHVVCRDWV